MSGVRAYVQKGEPKMMEIDVPCQSLLLFSTVPFEQGGKEVPNISFFYLDLNKNIAFSFCEKIT